MQQQKYDELYTHMLAVNAQNAKLSKEVQVPEEKGVEETIKKEMGESVKAQLLTKSFSKEMGDAVYNLYLRGATRKQIAKKF